MTHVRIAEIEIQKKKKDNARQLLFEVKKYIAIHRHLRYDHLQLVRLFF